MKKIGIFPTVLTISLGFAAQSQFTAFAHADEVYTFVIKKQEQKKKTRWSLQEWLDMKERNHWMDLWLAMNSPSPYEFFLDASFTQGERGGGYSGINGSFGAYASMVGLEFKRTVISDQTTRLEGLFGLRVFGYQIQGTHLLMQVGLRRDSRSPGTPAPNQGLVLKPSLAFYLTKHFGIDGSYAWLMDSNPRAGGDVSGSRLEGGAFIDFRFLRVFGRYFSEDLKESGASSVSDTGFAGGLKLFF